MPTNFDIRDNTVAQNFTTFSGTDIVATFEDVEIGNLQGLSLSVNREVRPVFVMGNSNAVSYSKGKRGVAGSLIMTIFDRDAFFDIKEQRALYYAKKSDYTPGFSNFGAIQDAEAANILQLDLARPNYSDQIPPFTVSLVARNEFGSAMTMSIYGVHLISEGTGISIDENIQEAQLTFVAKDVDWWKPLKVQV